MIPVSYTHLDVYKRQEYGMVLETSEEEYLDSRFISLYRCNKNIHRPLCKPHYCIFISVNIDTPNLQKILQFVTYSSAEKRTSLEQKTLLAKYLCLLIYTCFLLKKQLIHISKLNRRT